MKDLIFVFVLLAAFSESRCVNTAAAQRVESDELVVARVCLSEGARDCTAIAHVLVERAAMHGVSVRSMARAYAPRSTGRVPYVARPWLPLAHPDFGAPFGWPGVSSWERTRTTLAALTVVAWRALRGIEATPCPGALHWAASWCVACRQRMRASGLARVDCPSSNHFFARGQ